MARGDIMLNLRFRLDRGIHARIKEAADANNRSMNAEIESRLLASFETSKQIAPAVAELLDRHIEQEVQARLHAIAAKIGGAS